MSDANDVRLKAALATGASELPTARLLIPGEGSSSEVTFGEAPFDIDEVPLAFAYDLLEAQQRLPTAQELAAIAAALYELLPKESSESNWSRAAQLEVICNRL